MPKADNLPPSCAVVTKSGNLNLLEPSGPLQAFNGTDLPLPLPVPFTLNTEAVEVPWLVGTITHRVVLVRVWNSGGLMITGRKQNSD